MQSNPTQQEGKKKVWHICLQSATQWHAICFCRMSRWNKKSFLTLAFTKENAQRKGLVQLPRSLWLDFNNRSLIITIPFCTFFSLIFFSCVIYLPFYKLFWWHFEQFPPPEYGDREEIQNFQLHFKSIVTSPKWIQGHSLSVAKPQKEQRTIA